MYNRAKMEVDFLFSMEKFLKVKNLKQTELKFV